MKEDGHQNETVLSRFMALLVRGSAQPHPLLLLISHENALVLKAMPKVELSWNQLLTCGLTNLSSQK